MECHGCDMNLGLCVDTLPHEESWFVNVLLLVGRYLLLPPPHCSNNESSNEVGIGYRLTELLTLRLGSVMASLDEIRD